MNDVVLDTDVASYFFNHHPFAARYADVLGGCDLLLSFMSVAGLRAGAFSAGWGGRRRSDLEDFIRNFQVLYPDNDMCTSWAEIRADARRVGRVIKTQDAWVAATALALDAPLATNNRRDFQHIRQLRLLSS